MFWITSCFVLFLSKSALTLDEESVKELRCLKLGTNPAVNLKWVYSVEKWHFQLWSRLDLYRTAMSMLDLPIDSVSYSALNESCFYCDSITSCSGFGLSEPVGFDTSMDPTGVFTFKAKTKYAIQGTHTLGLTDNKNYVVGITCWEDDQASYSVWTQTHHRLISPVKFKILQYVQKLGFSTKHYIETPCTTA